MEPGAPTLDVAALSAWYRSWRDVTEEDVERVGRFLARGTLSVVSGGVLGQFETAFARFAGTRYAVACHNGTTALYAALWAAGVEPGTDVLACDYGFHGQAAAVLALGARLVPVDCRPDTLTLDPDDLGRKRTARARAVLVHHPWGLPADLDAIRAAAGDLPLVADASHAHGARFRDRPVAAWADVTAFSLGLGKLVTGGELGCAVTDRVELRDRLLVFGHVNRVPRGLEALAWSGNAVGLKLRPHPVACVLALGQLGRIDEKLARLRATCQGLMDGLAAAGFVPQAAPAASERVYWKLVLRLDAGRFAGVATEAVEAALRRAGVPVEENAYWPTLQDQPIFAWPGHETRVLRAPCPVAARVTPRTVTLPAPVTLPPEVTAAALAAARRVADDLAPRGPG